MQTQTAVADPTAGGVLVPSPNRPESPVVLDRAVEGTSLHLAESIVLAGAIVSRLSGEGQGLREGREVAGLMGAAQANCESAADLKGLLQIIEAQLFGETTAVQTLQARG